MRTRLVQFLDRLNAAQTLDAAWTEMVSHARANGVEWVHYGYEGSPACSTTTWPRLSSLPDSWLQHYADRGFSLADSGAAHCRRSVDPILAGPEFTEPDGSDLHRQFLEDCRELGVRSEIVFPLRSLPGARLGGMAAATRFRRAEARRWAAAMLPELRVAVQCADVRLLQLARAQEAEAVRLSPREREALLWLAAGLRNDRIAERMGITNPTVELHLANARRKLGAATREQALVRALVFGLVVP